MKKLYNSQSGIAHLVPVLLILVVLGVGGAGYLVHQRNSSADDIDSSLEISDSDIDNGANPDDGEQNDQPEQE